MIIELDVGDHHEKKAPRTGDVDYHSITPVPQDIGEGGDIYIILPDAVDPLPGVVKLRGHFRGLGQNR